MLSAMGKEREGQQSWDQGDGCSPCFPQGLVVGMEVGRGSQLSQLRGGEPAHCPHPHTITSLLTSDLSEAGGWIWFPLLLFWKILQT
jgi:hypothetical protein